MQQYAAAKDLVIVREFVEAGASARDASRPALTAMMEAALSEPPPFEVILIHSFSRFFRDAMHFELFKRQAEANGVEIVSITQLFEDYAATGTANSHTVRKWRTAVAKFVAHIGHDDATKVARADTSGWFTALVAGGLSVRTVAMTLRTAVQN